MNDWRPIETAPKKGEFLVWNGRVIERVNVLDKKLTLSTGWYFVLDCEKLSPEHFDADGDVVDFAPYFEVHDATHWMPFPFPPSPKEKEND